MPQPSSPEARLLPILSIVILQRVAHLGKSMEKREEKKPPQNLRYDRLLHLQIQYYSIEILIMKLVIVFFLDFLFCFLVLNFLSPDILFHSWNIHSFLICLINISNQREYLCDTPEKCRPSVLGHQQNHCLGTAGFPQASQKFTAVSSWILAQSF